MMIEAREHGGRFAGQPLGKKFASGTAVSSTSVQSFTTLSGGSYQFPYIVISGLKFKPSLIEIFSKNGDFTYETVYRDDTSQNYPKSARIASFSGSILTDMSTFHLKGDVSPASVTSTGFTIPVWATNATCYWVAYE